MSFAAFDVTMLGHSLKCVTINNMSSLCYPLLSLDGFCYPQPRQTGVLCWKLGSNLLGDGENMLGVASHNLTKKTTVALVFPVKCESFSSGHKSGGNKFAMHTPHRYFLTTRCFATSFAVSKKKQGRISKADDFDDKDLAPTEELLQNKPLGFGQGKVYDISLEDKLFEEIKCDKAAQAAALLKRKEEGGGQVEPNKIKKVQGKDEPKKSKKNKSSESSPTGVKVWVGNLPKKKNIERDLQLGFGEVSGLLHICPSELGNEKTRDPICKGIAYLTFENTDSANSFISRFQRESIRFGKTQKQLSYKILTDNATTSGVVSSMHGESLTKVPRLRVRDKTAELNVSFASIPISKIPIAGPATCVIPCSTSDGERIDEIWNELEDDDDAAVDRELAQNTGVCNALSISAETTGTGNAGDFELTKIKNGIDEFQEVICKNTMHSSRDGDVHYVPVAEDDSLNDESDYVSSDDDDVSTLLLDEEQEPETQLLSEEEKRTEESEAPRLEDERRIEELEKRLFKKIEIAGFEEQKKVKQVTTQQDKKEKGFKSVKSKPSKRVTGSHLGSASRLKKKEREFLTGALLKYGKGVSIAE